jgi:hypothetical protein
MLDTIFDVIVNVAERLMLSALILLIMTFLPIAWATMIYCSGGFIAESVAVMLFTGSVFFVYCFMRLLWVDVPLTDSSALVL